MEGKLTLLERIAEGEKAIAAAKAEGRDVSGWEAHLKKLKQLAFETAETKGNGMEPVCWNCGASMTQTKDIYGRRWWACWECARTA